MIEKINKLKRDLDSALQCNDLTSAYVLDISTEIDLLILQFYQEKEKRAEIDMN